MKGREGEERRTDRRGREMRGKREREKTTPDEREGGKSLEPSLLPGYWRPMGTVPWCYGEGGAAGRV